MSISTLLCLLNLLFLVQLVNAQSDCVGDTCAEGTDPVLVGVIFCLLGFCCLAVFVIFCWVAFRAQKSKRHDSYAYLSQRSFLRPINVGHPTNGISLHPVQSLPSGDVPVVGIPYPPLKTLSGDEPVTTHCPATDPPMYSAPGFGQAPHRSLPLTHTHAKRLYAPPLDWHRAPVDNRSGKATFFDYDPPHNNNHNILLLANKMYMVLGAFPTRPHNHNCIPITNTTSLCITMESPTVGPVPLPHRNATHTQIPTQMPLPIRIQPLSPASI
eukprot:TRINITY_DN77497_c0_g1_i1.p2 TRINITY_DN77497_c0_g1~~TRINITY_DN77497_c0_g1_i1.p2  ORF type:complete len:270 (-),score=20.44 TRINITY_DN77497_c0_g1_i1:770-1579(-)